MLAGVLMLAACAGGEPVTRATGGAPLGYAAVQDVAPGTVMLKPRYTVREIRVDVPRALDVSEANLFYPIADIVWRGEPKGDRYGQVRQVFSDAFGFGTSGMSGPAEAIVEVTVRRFHCLTEKTRYTVGGVYSIRFDLTVRDARTGAVLEGPRFVVADLKASGGARAIAEEQAGRTQRVVIVEHLAQVIRRELSERSGEAPLPSVTSRAATVAATAPAGG
jgi:hypothetical protein